MNDIEDRLKTIFHDHMGVERESITDVTRLVDDIGMDSLDAVELLIAVEEEFYTEIPQSEWDAATTFRDVRKCVEANLNG